MKQKNKVIDARQRPSQSDPEGSVEVDSLESLLSLVSEICRSSAERLSVFCFESPRFNRDFDDLKRPEAELCSLALTFAVKVESFLNKL